MRKALDALEGELIRQVLLVGFSYSDIAEVMGISRYQANRRYRHLAPESRRRKPKPKLLPKSAAERGPKEVEKAAGRLGDPFLDRQNLQEIVEQEEGAEQEPEEEEPD